MSFAAPRHRRWNIGVHHIPEKMFELIFRNHSISPAKKRFKIPVITREVWQQYFGIFTVSLLFISRSMVCRWLQLPVRWRYNTLWKKFDVAVLACLPSVCCYSTIMTGRILLDPPLPCRTPGFGNMFPAHYTASSWTVGLLRSWQTDKTSPRSANFVWRHRQSRGPEVPLRAGGVLLPQGLGKYRVINKEYRYFRAV